jgi:hypothetical protein
LINVSDAFKQKLQDGEKVWQEVKITFPDGTVKTVKDEIMGENCTFSDCAESSSFPIGCVICKSMTLELDNTSDQWKNYNFYMAKVHAYLKMKIDADTIETIDKGVYTITAPEQYGEILSFAALDDMYKTNAVFSTKLVLPQTVESLVRDACGTLGITAGFSKMTHGNLIVNELPKDMTYRQLFGWAAMLDTANARLDSNGSLQFVGWNLDVTPSIELKDYISMPAVSSDDIVITGINIISGDNSGTYGTSGYILSMENNLVGESDLATVAAQIGDSIIGTKFRNLQGDMAFNPLLEFGDVAYTYDRNLNQYVTPLTDVSCTVNGKTTLKTQADDPIRGMSLYYSGATKAIVAARQLVEKEKNARELAIKKLQESLSAGSGLFATYVQQEDGSTISYFHDKGTLEESKNVIKITSEAIGVSNDGGNTYPFGFQLTGTMITKLLYAEGINANYIDTGALTVRDKGGNILFQVDMDTKTVVINPDVLIVGNMTLSEKLKNMDENIASAKNMTFQLSNDMQTITSDADGNIPVFPTVTTTAKVMYGSNDITNDCSYTVTKSDSVTGSWDVNTHTYTVTGLTADDGWVDIKATYLVNLSITKRFTVSKQRSGKPGSAGKGIKGTPKSQYQVSESGTTAPTATWSDVVPKTKEGQFLWTKTVTEYTDGTSTTGYSVAYIGKNGTNGTNGTDGNGVIGTEVTYQASNNGTTPPTGEWSTTPPSAKEGQYIWTRVVTKYSKSSPVTAYSVGKIGENGKQLYTWRKYASMSDGSDTTDSPDYVKLLDSTGSLILDSTGAEIYTVTEAIYVGIADNKTTETPSDNPKDYIWSRFRGEDGVDGIGIPGENGETSYIHTAYANSIDGTVDFSTTDTDRIYIGHYSDFEKTDSADPAKYTWARMRGEDGPPGRTYYLRANTEILLMGQDKKVSPEKLTVNVYYRDGQGEETAYAGWWKAERSSDSGKTWTTISLNQTEATGACSITYSLQIIGSRGMIRVTCYLDQAKTSIADMQTYSVALDVASLTQTEIVEILSDNGKWKGLYYKNGQLYISFSAALGGELTLGGVNNGNGKLVIRDSAGNQVGYIDNTGVNFKKGTFSGSLNSANGTFTGKLSANTGNIAGWVLDNAAKQLISPNGIIILDAQNEEVNINGVALSSYGNGLVIDGGLNIICGAEPISDGTDKFQIFNLDALSSGNYLRIYDNLVYMSSSSSKRYKILGASLPEEFIENLYNIEPIMARYKEGYLAKGDERVGVEFPMFIAEDVDKYFPLAVDHNTDGLPENWNERIMIPAMFAMIKSQKEQLDRQEKLINQLYEKLNIEKDN